MSHDSEAASPPENLARLKVVVTYLGDLWPLVLHRRTYMQALGENEALRESLEQTYAAHVHNALQDVLLLDLFRELGALVLDRNPNSASVAVAVSALRDPKIMSELEAQYRIVPAEPVRLYNEKDLDAETIAAIQKSLHDDELRRNLEQLAALPASLEEIERTLLLSEAAKTIWTARSKAVAHYDVVRDGADWKMWRIGSTGLTYGQLDSYVEAATSAIDKLSHFVRRAAFDFKGSIEIGQKYAAEYVEALTIGLRAQRGERESKRLEIQRRLEAIQADSAESR